MVETSEAGRIGAAEGISGRVIFADFSSRTPGKIFRKNSDSPQHNAVHKCPWCASLIAGWLSGGVSIAFGVFVAVSPLPIVGDIVRSESLIRIFLGTMTFYAWLY